MVWPAYPQLTPGMRPKTNSPVTNSEIASEIGRKPVDEGSPSSSSS